MNDDEDVGSLIIKSADRLTSLRNLAYSFQLQINGENHIATKVFLIQNLNIWMLY